MQFERTYDYDLVREIVTHPKIYRTGLLADFHAPREQWRPVEDESIWYVVPRDDEGALAAFIFVPQNPICYEGHVAVLPRAWGHSADICLGVFAWLKEVTNWRKLICWIPAWNLLAIKLVCATGFTRIGINESSTLKDGVFRDMILFGRLL